MSIAAAAGSPVLASWQVGGNQVLPGLDGIEELRLMADGAGGYLLSVLSGDAMEEMVFQRGTIDGSLAVGWPAGGVALQVGRGGWRNSMPDGDGGLFAAWRRITPAHSDVVVQHLRGDGTRAPGWPDSGAVEVEGFIGPAVLSLAPDAEGGCFVAWQDFRAGYDGHQDPYLQRIASDGRIAGGWPANGAPLCGAEGDQFDPVILPDGEGGVLSAWWDRRNATATGFDVFATRVNASGSRASGWPVDGLAVCTAGQDQMLPVICGDGEGGFYVAWTDFREGTGAPAVYLQRVSGDGAIAAGWPADGARVGPGNGAGILQLHTDGSGGVYLGWLASVSMGDTEVWRRRLHHWTGAGAPVSGWPADGLPVFAEVSNSADYQVVPDGSGGIFACVLDDGATHEALLIRLAGDGRAHAGWPEPALRVPLRSSAVRVGLAEDGKGGVVVAWAPALDDSLYDGVFVQRVTAGGVIAPGWEGYPEAAWLGFPYPNPAGGARAIPFALSAAEPASLVLYDARGARVATLLDLADRPGGQQIVWWNGRDERGVRVPGGMYFLRMRAGSRQETRQLSVIR